MESNQSFNDETQNQENSNENQKLSVKSFNILLDHAINDVFFLFSESELSIFESWKQLSDESKELFISLYFNYSHNIHNTLNRMNRKTKWLKSDKTLLKIDLDKVFSKKPDHQIVHQWIKRQECDSNVQQERYRKYLWGIIHEEHSLHIHIHGTGKSNHNKVYSPICIQFRNSKGKSECLKSIHYFFNQSTLYFH